jgi:hypothetical protein
MYTVKGGAMRLKKPEPTMKFENRFIADTKARMFKGDLDNSFDSTISSINFVLVSLSNRIIGKLADGSWSVMEAEKGLRGLAEVCVPVLEKVCFGALPAESM